MQEVFELSMARTQENGIPALGSPSRTVHLNGVDIELRMPESLAPAVLRVFAGITPLDADIDSLPLPSSPAWRRWCVRSLRWYRQSISPRLGHRCVFEPSCSRYSELAFRNNGLLRGVFLTLHRLSRCRPGAGERDMP
jgi:putative component of membrane protein insertase Oxa1/YidC/SpoIIIJ protein YidD